MAAYGENSFPGNLWVILPPFLRVKRNVFTFFSGAKVFISLNILYVLWMFCSMNWIDHMTRVLRTVLHSLVRLCAMDRKMSQLECFLMIWQYEPISFSLCLFSWKFWTASSPPEYSSLISSSCAPFIVQSVYCFVLWTVLFLCCVFDSDGFRWSEGRNRSAWVYLWRWSEVQKARWHRFPIPGLSWHSQFWKQLNLHFWSPILFSFFFLPYSVERMETTNPSFSKSFGALNIQRWLRRSR